MTAAIAQLIVTLLSGLLPVIGSFTSGQAASVIALLENILPVAINEITSIVPSVQNIIAALQGNGSVTADQVTALQTLSAQYDAAFESAASDDGFPTSTQ